MSKNTAKNFKVLALILLTSALLITAISTEVPMAKAATSDSVYVYTTLGGTITANGATVTGGSSPTYDNGTVVSFTAVPSAADFTFLGWVYINGAAASSTVNPLSFTISAKSCAVEAMFQPTTNATQTSTGSGQATIALYFSAGGTTVPASGTGTGTSGTYTNYTVGTSSTFTAVPASDFKFLYWMIATSTVSTYTSTALTLKVPENTCVMQAFFVPTSSTVTLSPTPTPKVDEFSSAIALVTALALVAVAFGTYTYTKKAKK